METVEIESWVLEGGARYIRKRPYAFGDPIQRVDDHIVMDLPAATASICGKEILYQKQLIFDAEDVPRSDSGADTDTVIENYTEELAELVTTYPDNYAQLIGIPSKGWSIEVHGELVGDFGGETATEVSPLPPREKQKVTRYLERREK